jgi:hypothetical protein
MPERTIWTQFWTIWRKLRVRQSCTRHSDALPQRGQVWPYRTGSPRWTAAVWVLTGSSMERIILDGFGWGACRGLNNPGRPFFRVTPLTEEPQPRRARQRGRGLAGSYFEIFWGGVKGLPWRPEKVSTIWRPTPTFQSQIFWDVSIVLHLVRVFHGVLHDAKPRSKIRGLLGLGRFANKR